MSKNGIMWAAAIDPSTGLVVTWRFRPAMGENAAKQACLQEHFFTPEKVGIGDGRSDAEGNLDNVKHIAKRHLAAAGATVLHSGGNPYPNN